MKQNIHKDYVRYFDDGTGGVYSFYLLVWIVPASKIVPALSKGISFLWN